MLLVIIDAYSKWVEAIPMGSTSAALTIVQLRKLFAQFGLPTTLVSDNDPQFTAQEFEDFCSSNGIRHVRVTPYHPSSNGLAERAVRVVKEGLKKQNTTATLTDRLSRVLMSYRITPHSTTGIAPAELLFGRNLRSKLDLLKPSADRKRSDVVTKQQVQKQNHDKHSKDREFQIGDHVYVKIGVVEISGWQGPLQLCQALCHTMLGCPMAAFGNVTWINSESVTLTLLKAM